MGAIIALITTYIFGRKDGKNAERLEQKDKIVNQATTGKRIDNMLDTDIDRMPSKYD